MHRVSIGFFLCVLSGTAAAQRTWIVDAANGAGTDFTDLPAALTAASDGDTIRVRSGGYSAPTTSKGVTIVGETANVALTGAQSAQGLVVTGLPANRRFVLKRVKLSNPVITLTNNAGLVLLDSLDFTVQGFYQAMVTATNCGAVQLANCRLSGWPTLDVTNSTVMVDNCQLIGVPSGNGLRLTSGNVCVVGGAITGGAGNSQKYGFAPPGAAIVGYGGTLRLGGSGTTITAGSYFAFQTPAIQAQPACQIRIDPIVQLVPSGGAQAVVGGTVTTQAFAGLVANGGAPGTSIMTALTWRTGEAAALLAGRPMLPVPFNGGHWWIDPGLLLGLDFGTIDGTGRRAVTVPLPNDPALAGAVLAFHAVVTDGTGLDVSNGDVVVLY